MLDDALHSFQALMDGGGPHGLLHLLPIVFVVFPLLVLVHELGHALVGLATTKEPVLVAVGKPPGWVRGRMGRLRFQLSPLPAGDDEPAGFARAHGLDGPRAEIAYALGGPAANLLLGLVLLPLAGVVGGASAGVLVVTGGVSLLLTVGNLLPHRRGVHRSDGIHALEAYRALRGRVSDREVLDGAWQRFRTLLTHPDDRIRTPERGLALAAVSTMAHVAGDPVPTTRERLVRAAFAGWCWREVEPGRGAPDVAVRVAVDRALGAGRERPGAIVRAASELAQSSWAPSNDGVRPLARGARLERVAKTVISTLGSNGTDAPQLVLAFRYGLAMHDVERLLDTM